MVTATDFFCGAGGSSTGLVAAGIEVLGAANHWKLAIETHNTNHPQTAHYLDDLQQAHPSWYPRTDIAWFSPSCTNHSLAKGRKRKGAHQLDLWGESGIDPDEERSRATMREVVEFSEYHRYEVVIVENVVDIRYWQFYDEWMTAMLNLGYDCKVLYLNAQFFGVPQSRDRFYAVFWKRGNRVPKLDFRPGAVCPTHGTVEAVQSFKKEFRWGRYGSRRQYVYCCPHCGAVVQPGFVPAAAIIDWSLPSETVGSRQKPLKEKTLARILAGLRKFGHSPQMVDLAYGQQETGRVIPATEVMPTQTTRQTVALVQPFIASQHLGRDAVRTTDRELPCITTMNNEHALVTPPAFITTLRGPGQYLPGTSINEPIPTIVATASQQYLVQPFVLSLNHSSDRTTLVDKPLNTVMPQVSPSLVTPFVMSYYGDNPTFARVDEPLPTLRTVSHEAIITPEDMLSDCGFRMLEPHELKRGMSFPAEYVVLGSKRDQVRQIGNAVCCNVATWIGERVAESLS